jgi:hypothetical protein
LRPAVDITYKKFKPATTRVALSRNHLRKKADRDYIWRIDALEGLLDGITIGLATEAALTGPIGYIGGNNPAITGYLSLHPLRLVNPQHRPLTVSAWRGRAPSAAILASDGEVWTVTGPMRDTGG